jgi:hypothetical protein
MVAANSDGFILLLLVLLLPSPPPPPLLLPLLLAATDLLRGPTAPSSDGVAATPSAAAAAAAACLALLACPRPRGRGPDPFSARCATISCCCAVVRYLCSQDDCRGWPSRAHASSNEASSAVGGWTGQGTECVGWLDRVEHGFGWVSLIVTVIGSAKQLSNPQASQRLMGDLSVEICSDGAAHMSAAAVQALQGGSDTCIAE